MLNPRLLLPVLTCSLLLSLRTMAEEQNPIRSDVVANIPSALSDTSLQLSVGRQHLSNDFPSWRDATLRGLYKLGAHVLQGEFSAKREFNESGIFFGVSDTYTFNPLWDGSIDVGAGNGAFYLPRIRTDAFLYRKWLEKLNLVTAVGLGYYKAPDGHIDRSVQLSATYYFELPLVIEAGARVNLSNPGSIKTSRRFVAATYGREKNYLISARYDWGAEGYQAIAEKVTLVDFHSKDTSVSWRRWVDRSSGFTVELIRYTNPTYKRLGINIGLFHEF
jgi:YaiO family outer membrane protein